MVWYVYREKGESVYGVGFDLVSAGDGMNVVCRGGWMRMIRRRADSVERGGYNLVLECVLWIMRAKKVD